MSEVKIISSIRTRQKIRVTYAKDKVPAIKDFAAGTTQKQIEDALGVTEKAEQKGKTAK